jgi:hypothetical protein
MQDRKESRAVEGQQLLFSRHRMSIQPPLVLLRSLVASIAPPAASTAQIDQLQDYALALLSRCACSSSKRRVSLRPQNPVVCSLQSCDLRRP